MKRNAHLFASSLLAALMSVALTACDRASDPTKPTMGSPSTNTQDNGGGMARSDTMPPSTSSSSSGTVDNSAVTTSEATAGTLPGSMVENNPTAAGNPSGGQLSTADRTFIRQAAENGMYEVAVARLAVERASDPAVKSFASMLVNHHATANEKLREVAATKKVQIPTTIPQEKQQVIDRLGKASGADFDRQFVQQVGIQDHQASIAKFEQAGQAVQDPLVKDFAQSTLPTLRGHLSEAQKLPVPQG